MKIATLGVVLSVCAGGVALAQDSVVGKYTGSYEAYSNRTGTTPVGLAVVIESVEDGKVKATGTNLGRACGGDYPLEGTLKGDEIALRATAKGGRAGDCGFGFRGRVEGNKLVGRFGKYEVELRK